MNRPEYRIDPRLSEIMETLLKLSGQEWRDEERSVLQKVFQELPEAQTELLMYIYLYELGVEEVAYYSNQQASEVRTLHETAINGLCDRLSAYGWNLDADAVKERLLLAGEEMRTVSEEDLVEMHEGMEELFNSMNVINEPMPSRIYDLKTRERLYDSPIPLSADPEVPQVPTYHEVESRESLAADSEESQAPAHRVEIRGDEFDVDLTQDVHSIVIEVSTHNTSLKGETVWLDFISDELKHTAELVLDLEDGELIYGITSLPSHLNKYQRLCIRLQ